MRTKISCLVALPLVALLLAGCNEKKHDTHHKREHVQVQQKTVQVEKLHDGRYAYYDDGFWWYYIIVMNNQNSAANSSAWSTSSAGRVSLPAGGTWSKSTTAPAKEEVEETQEATVEENATGEPMTEAEAQAAEQANAESDAQAGTTETETTTETAPTEAAPAAETSGGDGGGGGGGE